MPLRFRLDGRDVEVGDEDVSLLEVLRDRLGVTTAKDGCSPQGQCGCCTVLVDGQPRVSCVTPARRVAGREVTTVDGLGEDERNLWAAAFCSTGASQCGFCTPGIIVRLAALKAKGVAAGDHAPVERALLAHLCRCTGWRTILDAYDAVAAGEVAKAERDLAVASRRAGIEGGVPQAVGPQVALGRGGFADDTAPRDALVAVPVVDGGWSVAPTLSEARAGAGKVQGRRTTIGVTHPIDVPDGDWALTLRTTWVEPAYLETDASWCEPGGQPATPVANGGAFGGKTSTTVTEIAASAARERGAAIRALYSREDAVRLGPKRPPLAAGVRADGTGVVRVARTPGIADAIRSVAPALVVEEVDVAGPPTSAALRAAGWAEAVALLAGLAGTQPVRVVAPTGAEATATFDGERIGVTVACGDVLDDVVLRSYCVGAAHMALGWVTSEAIRVDEDGVPQDLTIRSFGIVKPTEMPPVDVEIVVADGPPVNGSDAVFAAVAAAVWVHEGRPTDWPTRRGGA